MSQLTDFDWDVSGNYIKFVERYQPSIIGIMEQETYEQRTKRMLLPLSTTCTACSMCELGITPASRDNESRDPHVFSNMNPSRFMVIGQNPGWNEVKRQTPFVGQAGKNFDAELAENGFSRDVFYITNAVKCFTQNNAKPEKRIANLCAPILQMEINLLRPLLVITLGATAFQLMCPDNNYGDSLCKIVKSEKFGVSIFAVYHPSPLNISDKGRYADFKRQIAILCRLINAIASQHQIQI